MKLNRMETYYFSRPFTIADMLITPIYVRAEQLQPSIPAHQHSVSSYEFHYCKSGSGHLIVDDQTYLVEPNTIYMTGPAVIHAQLSTKESPIIEHCLFLDCKCSESAVTNPLHLFAKTHFWIGKDSNILSPILETLLTENRNPSIDTVEFSEILLRQFILQLVRIYRESIFTFHPNSAYSIRSSAINITLIDDVFCYQHKNLTLNMLAGMLNLSVRQTQRLLQKYFGKTFSQKLTEARIAEAMQLLRNTDSSITEISEHLGFSSIEYFSSTFRKLMNCSPREYRKSKSR